MRGRYSEAEAETIRAFVRSRNSRKKAELAARLRAARQDCDAIVSDIDIAVEGITDPAALSALRSAAEKLTRFPLDIVAIEHVHPAYAEHIRRRGKVVYERQRT